MKIETVKIVYFSPTGTTKAIVDAVAKGVNNNQQELIDITKPKARQQVLETATNDLLIVVIPVYMGRLPAFISDWLQSIKADNTPVVCVVMYGNRAYDNALLELRDTLTACNCKPFAGAAFIGEHSFSSDELPSSVGRPDESDIHYAESFGRKMYEKLLSISDVKNSSELIVPGNFPYGGVTNLWKVDFIAVSNSCTQCGICAEGCPTGAINFENSKLIDIDKCTLCCACIKHCPQKAKKMKSGQMKDAAIRCTQFIERKEPEFFL
jgi:ferredoxin/NAD(P)H-dependent FMN reductase